ncbi:MAG: M64 family metallopeptidase [Acidobacteriota bacterium]
MLHFANRGDQVVLLGGMIAPGTVRSGAGSTAGSGLLVELVGADGRITSAQQLADPRRMFGAPTAGQSHQIDSENFEFTLRLPWSPSVRRVRIREESGKLLIDAPLSEQLVQDARRRYQEVRQRVLSQADLARRWATQAPARIDSGIQLPDRFLVEQERLRSAAQLEDARISVRRAMVTSGSQSAVVGTSIRVMDLSGLPIQRAGVVFVDPASGKTLGGAETGPDGRAGLNINATRARLYIFPPLHSGRTPALARRTVDADFAGKSSWSQDVTLDPGVLVEGAVTKSAGGPAADLAITAVDAVTNQSIEYTRSDDAGRYGLRVPPGRYRFFVGPQAGSGVAASSERVASGPSLQLDLSAGSTPLVNLQGKVTSRSGQPIAGARLVLFDAASNVFNTLTSGADGLFAGSAPRDGFVFVIPNSSTSYQSMTRNIADLGTTPTIALSELSPIRIVDPSKPQLGLVHGDPADRTRLNLVFVADGYTDLNEPFSDVNQNGRWDGDTYLDENRNGRYDQGEAFLNRDGVAGYQPGEPFTDLNGDGYRSSDEQALFDRNVIDYVRVLVGTSPWPELLSRVNIWRIRTISNQTAGTFPEFGLTRDTALGTSYGPKASEFFVSVSNLKVAEIVHALVPDYDHVLVVSNSPVGLGRANAHLGGNARLRGGNFDTLSTVATHELGHAVGLLADEYSDATLADGRHVYPAAEPAEPNISTVSSAAQVKWAHELDASAPSPTPSDFAGAGVFEGAGTYFRGLYRPEYNCMMRYNTPRFCVVCSREIRARILERSSSHSLNFPLLVSNDDASTGERLLTAFSVVNPDATKDLEVGYTALYEMGRLVAGRGVSNPAVQTLDPLEQEAALDREIFGLNGSEIGWVRANTAAPAKGFYLIADSAFSQKMDGAVANPEASADLALPYVQQADGSRFFFSVVNPSNYYTPVLLTYYGAAGNIIKEETRTLLGHGQLFLSAPAGHSGWIRIRSTMPEPVALQCAAFSYNAKSLTVQSAMALDASADTLTFPHFVVGGGYDTKLALSSVAQATLEIKAWRNDGTLIGAYLRPIGAGQQLVESVASLLNVKSGAPAEVGYLTISEATRKTGGMKGVAGLTEFSLGKDAAISAGERTARNTLTFSHLANDVPAGGGRTFLTGLTLVNPSELPAQYTITVFSKAGKVIAERRMSLGGKQKISALLSGDPSTGGAFFPNPLSAGSGYIIVKSDQPLFGFELFFTDDVTLLAAVPAQ